MPWPLGGFSAPPERQISDFVTSSGAHQVSTLIGISRSYELSWLALHQTTFDRITPYALGHMGVGPFAFIDPSRPNMLTPNQSSNTAVWHDSTDWQLGSATAEGALSSNNNSTWYHRQYGRRSLKWSAFNGSLDTFCVLTPVAPYFAWSGFPVVPGLPYTYSYFITPQAGAGTGNCIYDTQLQWLDKNGAVISTAAVGAVNTTTWAPGVLTAVAPFNAAFVIPRVVITSGSISAASVIYIDESQLEQSGSVNEWAPGTGTAAVAIMGWTEDVWVDASFRIGPVLNLREVAP